MLNPEERLVTLREYLPNAEMEDWTLIIAGQRVQIVKDTPEGGPLQFGTEVVGSADGGIAALLDASTAVPIMIKSLQTSVFKGQLASAAWQARMKEMVPSYGHKLDADPVLAKRIRQQSAAILGLNAVKLDEPVAAQK